MEKITHIKKDNLNRIIQVKTDKGHIYDVEKAKKAISLGKISNAEIIKKDNGRTIIENVNEEYSLMDLPEF